MAVDAARIAASRHEPYSVARGVGFCTASARADNMIQNTTELKRAVDFHADTARDRSRGLKPLAKDVDGCECRGVGARSVGRSQPGGRHLLERNRPTRLLPQKQKSSHNDG